MIAIKMLLSELRFFFSSLFVRKTSFNASIESGHQNALIWWVFEQQLLVQCRAVPTRATAQFFYSTKTPYTDCVLNDRESNKKN